jgi:hypothetical protein
MANAAYRKLADNSYLQQVGNAGGPLGMKVQFNTIDSLWYGMITSNFVEWIMTPGGFASQATAQTTLDAYVAELNAGTA